MITRSCHFCIILFDTQEDGDVEDGICKTCRESWWNKKIIRLSFSSAPFSIPSNQKPFLSSWSKLYNALSMFSTVNFWTILRISHLTVFSFSYFQPSSYSPHLWNIPQKALMYDVMPIRQNRSKKKTCWHLSKSMPFDL